MTKASTVQENGVQRPPQIIETEVKTKGEICSPLCLCKLQDESSVDLWSTLIEVSKIKGENVKRCQVM